MEAECRWPELATVAQYSASCSGVKMLSVNGVYPDAGRIRDGSYPIIAEFYAIYRSDNTNPHIPEIVDWILSDEGQEIVGKTGYVSVR